jgi:hypothetical protein
MHVLVALLQPGDGSVSAQQGLTSCYRDCRYTPVILLDALIGCRLTTDGERDTQVLQCCAEHALVCEEVLCYYLHGHPCSTTLLLSDFIALNVPRIVHLYHKNAFLMQNHLRNKHEIWGQYGELTK